MTLNDHMMKTDDPGGEVLLGAELVVMTYMLLHLVLSGPTKGYLEATCRVRTGHRLYLQVHDNGSRPLPWGKQLCGCE